jgi:hypothetical protein
MSNSNFNENAICNNLKWTKQDNDLFYELMKAGKTYAQVAVALGRSQRSIENHAYQMRMQRRKLGISDVDLYANRPRRKKQGVNIDKIHQKFPKQSEPKTVEGALFDKRIGNLLIWTAVLTGGCLLTLVTMTIILISIA